MVTVTAPKVWEDLNGFEDDLMRMRFNLNNYQGAPTYLLQKLHYYNVKLLQLSGSVNQFKSRIPRKFRNE